MHLGLASHVSVQSREPGPCSAEAPLVTLIWTVHGPVTCAADSGGAPPVTPAGRSSGGLRPGAQIPRAMPGATTAASAATGIAQRGRPRRAPVGAATTPVGAATTAVGTVAAVAMIPPSDTWTVQF